ncbi:MAG: tRNA lysidine(34) synthetase TilS [Armatimonadota bacterium]
MVTLQERFREFNQSHGLFSPGDRILLGFSGGADSMCLLLLLAQEPIEVVAAHLDHRLRAESGEEARQCAELAASLGVEFVCESTDVRALAEVEGVGIEEAGRLARYAFFERARRQVGAQLIATAHTLDDHVETMLLNLARGTGLRGLVGIPVRRVAVIRPLLFARKSETDAFCRERGVAFIQDPSNLDDSHARVRARRELMPAFERLHAGALESAARAAEILREEDALLDGLASFELKAAWEARHHPLARWIARYHARYSRARLAALPLALRRRAVMLAVREMGGSPTFEIANSLASAIASGERIGANLEGGVLAKVTASALVVKSSSRVQPFEQRLEVPGAVCGEGWRIVAASGSAPRSVGRRALEQSLKAPAGCSLAVRLAGDDDRIAYGPRARRVLSALKAEGVPQEARTRLPVVADAEGVVWVPGLGVAERARPGSGEAAILLRLELS